MANMGPAAGRPQPMVKDDSAGMPGSSVPPQANLATFIYDYFLKKGKIDLANAMMTADLNVRVRPRQKRSPGNGAINGVDDPMDLEPKDELTKKIEALPEADIQEQLPKDSFLEDWWCVFWDIWSAGKGRKSSGAAASYAQQTAQQRNLMQQRLMQQSIMNNMRFNGGMPGGMNAGMNGGMNGGMNPNMARMNPNDIRLNAMRNQGLNQMTRNMTPQQAAQMQSDMANQQRPPSPMSSDNAPSPKRARVGEAAFGTPQMNAGGPNRPVGMPMNGPGQQPGMMPNGLEMPNGAFANMAGNPQNRMQQFGNMAKFPGGKPEYPNNPELPFESMNLFNAPEDQMARGMGGNGSQQGGALADYQMQLMLLEQQNKKRLLMARQEQEVTSQGGGPPGATQAMMGAGAPGTGAPFQAGLSPRRNGQSPSPNDPTKRANSSMGHASPRPDGQMPMTRGSPAPGGFDPSQMPPGMGGQFPFNPQLGPNGMRPGGPGFQGPGNPMTMEQIRARGMPPNWAAGQGVTPGNVGPGQPGGPNNNHQNPMPPPSAPNVGPNAGRTNPSSPAPGVNPPTPQQNKNANPKGGKKDAPKDNKKGKGGKKGANNPGATPSSEAEGNGPPTPTPSTPITPSPHNNPFKNGPPGPTMQGQNNGQPPHQPGMPGQDPNGMNPNNPFGQIGDHSNDVDFQGFDLSAPDTADVLEGFDFDSFLNTDSGEAGFAFDNTFNMNGDGVEMNARDV